MVLGWLKQFPKEMHPDFIQFFEELDKIKAQNSQTKNNEQISINIMILNECVRLRYQLRMMVDEIKKLRKAQNGDV